MRDKIGKVIKVKEIEGVALSQKLEEKPHHQKPTFAAIQAKCQQGLTLHQQGRFAEAERAYQEILQQVPSYFDALHLLGLIALQTHRTERSVELITKAIELNPNVAAAHSNLGMALTALDRPEEALVSCDRAIALEPGLAEAHYNRGIVLYNMQRYQEALASYVKAVTLKPDYAEAHNNRGTVLTDLKRSEQALASFDQAIALKPDFSEAHYNRGAALNRAKRFAEAFAAYDKAYALKPDLIGAEGDRLHAKMQLCDWSNFDSECAHLISSVRNGTVATPPFPFLIIASSTADQLQCAKQWAANKCPPSETPIWRGDRYQHDRMRVAYFSADFHAHATAYLMAELFEMHDKSRFEVTAFSFGPDERDEMRQRVSAAVDRFVDVRTEPDREVAMLARKLEVDIAVDLKGFTGDSRTGIFASRAAPLQISYLGYPGTMGANYIDYLVADPTLIPASSQQHFSEKILYLPNSYQVNDRKRRIADKTFARAELGLPESGFVFCCFNNNYKITPDMFDAWMGILGQVHGSVLWLLKDNASAVANLRKEAAARGISPERLVFAERMSLPDHLARHRLADLFLDTLPCNAHTTASDALWAGLPVLTCIGETFAGRVAASLLSAIGLPELVSSTPQAYRDLAVELAANPEKLSAIKRKLANNRLATSLFDTRLFTRHIEAAYTAIYDRYQAGLPPDHVYVPQ